MKILRRLRRRRRIRIFKRCLLEAKGILDEARRNGFEGKSRWADAVESRLKELLWILTGMP